MEVLRLFFYISSQKDKRKLAVAPHKSSKTSAGPSVESGRQKQQQKNISCVFVEAQQRARQLLKKEETFLIFLIWGKALWSSRRCSSQLFSSQAKLT